MPELATYVGIEPRSEIASAAIARGLRCILNTSNQLALAGIGIRGDFVTLTDAESGLPVACASLGGGGKVAMVASETTAVGDPAYSAANGQTSKTLTGAQVIGKWTTVTAAGALGEVEIASVI